MTEIKNYKDKLIDDDIDEGSEICKGHENNSEVDSIEKAMAKLKLATLVSVFFIIA